MRRTMGLFAVGLGAACALAACSGDDKGSPGAGLDGGSSTTEGGVGHPGDDGGSSAPDGASAADARGSAPDGGGSTGEGSTPDGDGGGGSDASSDGDAAALDHFRAVYTMTNAASGNAILGFARAADGSLAPMAAPFATGGKGTGAALGEQGAIALDAAKDRLYAVNAGDGSFSILPVKTDGSLGVAITVPGAAGLIGPKSITFRGDVVYVLYEGDATHPSAIAGYTVGATGATPIAGSMHDLSSDTKSVDPAQIQFTPDGQWLVVTEKQTSTIDSFAVDASGVATKVGFYPTASAGADAGLQMVPYGFAFVGDHLVVSEAGSTGVGTYAYAKGVIAPVTAGTQFLPTDPAPCWVAVSSDWAYVANARGPDVSGFTVAPGGALTPIGSAANAVVATTGKTIATADGGTAFQGPTDEAVSADGSFLYVLDAAVPAIGIFAVGADGSLTRVGTADYAPGGGALVAGVVGLAAM